MILPKTNIYQHLLDHIGNKSIKSCEGFSIFHCHTLQQLHDVPVQLPTLVLIVSGQKQLLFRGKEIVGASGDILLLPGNINLVLKNSPGNASDYFSVVINFLPKTLAQFSLLYAESFANIQQNLWKKKAPSNILTSIFQWLLLCQQHSIDKLMIQNRQIEMLLMLCKLGYAGNLINNLNASWKQKITQIILSDISYEWKLNEISNQLAMSGSTLRRNLKIENTNFRTTLEETRLVTSLSILQEFAWPLSFVAQKVGYRSQSRFGERFKKRFGMSPSEYRKTTNKERFIN